MTKFWQVNEDPFYDEDGILIDEDAEWAEIEAEVADLPQEDASPFATINS
jgi:hypothetical protein